MCGTFLYLYSVFFQQKSSSSPRLSKSRPYLYPPAKIASPKVEVPESKDHDEAELSEEVVPIIQVAEQEHTSANTGQNTQPMKQQFNESTSIKELWKNSWAKTYVDARPFAPKIELSRAHVNQGVSPNDKSFRVLAGNRVKNPAADIIDLQLAHANFVASLFNKMEMGENVFSGKGIVTIGGSSYFGPTIVSIHMLRQIGSLLPVEVFLADRNDFEAAICEGYLLKLNAKCIIISDILDDATQETDALPISHYQLKSLALLFSSFSEILWLDSDNIPLINPDVELFNTEPYLSHGFISWPDFWMGSESPLFYKVAGISFPSNLPRHSSESGQLMINKQTHIKTLLLATYYNFYGPEYYYSLLSQGAAGEGDKETFLAAAVVLGERYYRVTRSVKSVNRFNGGVKISGMVQYHPGDDLQRAQTVRPAFLHANSPKMNAAHLLDQKDQLRLWGTQQEQVRQFDRDLEKQVGIVLVDMGCKLADILRDWKGKVPQLCDRLHERYDAIFINPEKQLVSFPKDDVF